MLHITEHQVKEILTMKEGVRLMRETFRALREKTATNQPRRRIVLDTGSTLHSMGGELSDAVNPWVAQALNSKREVEKQLLLYAIAVKRALGFDALKAKAYFLSQKPPDDKLIKEGASEVIDVDISQEKQKIVLNSV